MFFNRRSTTPEISASTFRATPATLRYSALCLALCQTAAHAGGVVGQGNPASCNDAALKRALEGGGTVTFNCGAAPANISLGSENRISANTVINGGNRITINGNNAVRLFKVAQRTAFTLQNIKLVNGKTAGQGAAIYADYGNAIKISNSAFSNHVANQIGEAGGGAIYSSNGTLNIGNSVFTGNRGSIGGAVRVLNSNLSVISSTFTGNKAVDRVRGNGGAIYIDGANGDGGQIVIRTSTFTGNSATTFGGAIFNSLYNDNKTAITGSKFIANSAGTGSTGQGGAIWSNGDAVKSGHWMLNKNTSTLTIVDTTISGNTATWQGGGVFVARHPQGTVISQSTISDNKTLGSNGGGVLQADNGKLSLVNTTVSGNKAGGQYSLGGGVFIVRTARAFITNATIANNTANWQAGGVFGDKSITMKNSILANNVALNGGNNWNIQHNCSQPVISAGNNLQFPKPKDTPCAAGILIADPNLDVLKNNGGLTPTRALLPGSEAINRAGGCPTTDQRNFLRIRQGNSACDIGAFEKI